MAIINFLYLGIGIVFGLWVGSRYPKEIQQWFRDIVKKPKKGDKLF